MEEYDNTDDPAKLPPDRIVTADQLRMKPGQLIQEKARELGVRLPTLRLWHAERRGSGYDPDYVIRCAGHANWLRSKWKDCDWCEALRQQITKKQHRHVGDLLLELGITTSTAQYWTQKHAEFGDLLWAEPHPPNHWPTFLAYVRYSTIDDYRERKAAHIASGMGEVEAGHLAADEAINELKHQTRQRRRVERDTLIGVGGHEELLRRYRKGGRLTDAYSRRIGKQLFKVSRAAAMERGLREVGYPEAEIEEILAKLMGAFQKSETDGQAQWKKTRDAILRRRAAADAYAKAEEVEMRVMQTYADRFGTKLVKKWVKRQYGAQSSGQSE